MHFNVNFNVFFLKLKVHLLVSELYIYQNARCKKKKIRLNMLYLCNVLAVSCHCQDTVYLLYSSFHRLFICPCCSVGNFGKSDDTPVSDVTCVREDR